MRHRESKQIAGGARLHRDRVRGKAKLLNGRESMPMVIMGSSTKEGFKEKKVRQQRELPPPLRKPSESFSWKGCLWKNWRRTKKIRSHPGKRRLIEGRQPKHRPKPIGQPSQEKKSSKGAWVGKGETNGQSFASMAAHHQEGRSK